jgi:hypothetical protein
MVTKTARAKSMILMLAKASAVLILRSGFRYEFLRDRYARFVLVFD